MVDQVRKMADRRADPVGQAAVSVLETLVEALIAGSVEGMVVALVTFEKKEFGRMRELRSRKKST